MCAVSVCFCMCVLCVSVLCMYVCAPAQRPLQSSLTHAIHHSPKQALGANHVFVSHAHIDHIGALLNHARARTLSNKPAKYYVPLSAVEPLKRAKEAYEALDGCAFQCEIQGVQPGMRLFWEGLD